MYWVGFPLAIALALLVVPAGARGLRDAGLVRENYRGAPARLPARGGAGDGGAGRPGAARLPQRPRRPRPARPRPAALAALPARHRLPRLPRRRPRPGREAAATPRGWRGHARALREGRLSTGAIKAIGALALAAYVVSGRGLESWRYLADVALLILATNLFNLLDLRPGRAEKGWRCSAPGSASAPGRWRRSNCWGSSPARSWSAPGSPCASGRCWATPAPT